MFNYSFSSSLSEGIILSRPNRFLMKVNSQGEILTCHCPSTGKIGNISFKNIPCLLSKSKNPNRKTKYTVEAISLDNNSITSKSWIGINQIAINHYIEFFLNSGFFHPMISSCDSIQREKRSFNSRLDFLINNNIFLEVKMPLNNLLLNPKKDLKINFSSTTRLEKHLLRLSNLSQKGFRVILLLCFLYDALLFLPPNSNRYNTISKIMHNALQNGLEIWQANFQMTPIGITSLYLKEITSNFLLKKL